MIVNGELCWLTLCGDTGLGKTHLALAAGWEWLEQRKRCRYSRVDHLLARLKRCYDYTPEQAWELKEPRFDDLFEAYLDTSLLILDDLGVETLTPWVSEKLDWLIDHRWLRQLPLVVTTNVPLDRLSPRIASRLQDRQLGRVITLTGKDYRLEAHNKKGG